MAEYLLQEDGTYLLQETGDKIILQEGSSPSLSVSPSSSISPSSSSSASPSASPSFGYSIYSRENQGSLNANDDDLATPYTEQEEIDVATSDDTRVGLSASLEYMVHQFKNFVGGQPSAIVTWEGQSTYDPRLSTVYLQIFNQGGAWETIDSNNTALPDTDFILSASIADLADYKDPAQIIACRVYQLII